MTKPDEEELVSAVGPSTFVDRYTDAFVDGLDVSSASVHSFDRFLVAENGTGNDLVWGAAHGFSKHLALITDDDVPEETIAEIRPFLRQLNDHASKRAVASFRSYLQEHYDSLTELPANALVEVPDPTATKLGDYPVVNVVVYAYPEGDVVTTVEVTLKQLGFSVEGREDVADRVGKRTPTGDVERYAHEVYDETLQAVSEEVNANVVADLTAEDLDAAGYGRQGQTTVPEDVHPIYGGEDATHWQKEIWTVDGIEAATGFARIWLLDDADVGVVAPTAGDFESESAIQRIKTELIAEEP